MKTQNASHGRYLRFVVFAMAVGLIFTSDSSAQVNTSTETAECCLAASTELDSYLNLPGGHDDRFFRGIGGRPNLALVFMRNRRQLQLSHQLPELRTPGAIRSDNNGEPAFNNAPLTLEDWKKGCENTVLDNLTYFHPNPVAPAVSGAYNPAVAYPPPEDAYASTLAQTASGNPNGNAESTKTFSPNLYYRYLEWDGRCDDGGCNGNADLSNACSFAGGAGTLSHTACLECVTQKGYWINPTHTIEKSQNDSAVFHGRFLNFYPPRFLMMRMAIKTVLKAAFVDGMRIAVFQNMNNNGAGVVEHLHPPCNNNGGPNKNSVGNAITSQVVFENDHNPYGEALANVGQYLTQGNEAAWETLIGGDGGKSGDNINVDKEPSCNDCQRHFLMVFGDGRGDNGTPACDPENDGLANSPCTLVDKCEAQDMGDEGDGNNYIDTVIAPNIGTRQPYANTCDFDWADDVARFVGNADLDPTRGGKQGAFIYSVGIGSDYNNRHAVLRAIADKGDGLYMKGTSYKQLVDALVAILEDIIRRSTAFSGSTVSSLQTGATGTAYVPRFRPDLSRNWKGYLYRWRVFSEFVKDKNLNDTGSFADTDKDDFWLVQKSASDPTVNDIVGEDDDGNFILKNTGAAATPVWEASAVMQSKPLTDRKIYTVIDNDADAATCIGTLGACTGDGRLDSKDTMIEFDEANAAQIAPYLHLEGNDTCTNISTALADPTIATDINLCAKKVIRYARGYDVFDEDGDGDSTEKRDHVLGDIYHSTPILVDSPQDTFVCDLGLSGQCARTIYSTRLGRQAPTPLEEYTAPDGKKISAYEKWRVHGDGAVLGAQKRKRIVLVGANDGMLHAFHAGDPKNPFPTPTTTDPLPETHTEGDGRELWAIIPPDMLPKLKMRLARAHREFVDGDIMLRDIWVDGSGSATTSDSKKQWDEFKTVAVVGERRGGNKFFAIDVTDTETPKFLWMFPQPCDVENMEVAQTWNTTAPKPPPIGPVLLAKTGATERLFTIEGADVKVAAEERWAVFLNGGYDPQMNRGQGFYVLDVYKGDLIFKRYFDATDPLLQHMKFPFAATPAAVDYGSGNFLAADQDGFFDTLVLGDTGGQVWTLRMYDPRVDLTGRRHWYLARSFEQNGNAGEDGDDGIPFADRNPFFYLPSNAIDTSTGKLMTFLGSGDRYNIRDPKAGTCRYDNPAACGKYGCGWTSDLSYEYSGQKVTSRIEFAGVEMKGFTRTSTASTNTNACGFVAGSQTNAITSCNTAPGTVIDTDYSCASGTPYSCSLTYGAGTPNIANVDDNFATTGLGANRFYGFWSYGGDASKRMEVTTSVTDPATIEANFDAVRVREANLKNLSDATATPPTNPKGWFYTYDNIAERTGSGSSILSGCVLWNSLKTTATTGATCVSGSSSEARLYQANVVTGAPDCSESHAGSRFLSRSAIAPPPEPALTVSVSSTGQIKYSVIGFEAGADQPNTADVQISRDPVQLIYSIDVPFQLHQCRHVAGAVCP